MTACDIAGCWLLLLLVGRGACQCHPTMQVTVYDTRQLAATSPWVSLSSSSWWPGKDAVITLSKRLTSLGDLGPSLSSNRASAVPADSKARAARAARHGKLLTEDAVLKGKVLRGHGDREHCFRRGRPCCCMWCMWWRLQPPRSQRNTLIESSL